MKKVLLYTMFVMLTLILVTCTKKAPTITLTTPEDGDIVTWLVDITADVSDPDDVECVLFYINDTIRDTLYSEPYTYQWGTYYTEDSTNHSIYAVLRDDHDRTASSETISVMVDNSGEPHNRVRLLSAVINGETLTVSDPEITVTVNGSITGQAELQTVNLGEAGWVAPLAGTASWGAHETAYWGIDGWIPTGTANFTSGINLTAPAVAGSYYIYFSFGHEMEYEDVMSLTNWQYPGGPTWNDSADVADWNDHQAQQCIAKGYVITRFRWGSGDYGNIYVGGAAIRVTVNP